MDLERTVTFLLEQQAAQAAHHAAHEQLFQTVTRNMTGLMGNLEKLGEAQVARDEHVSRLLTNLERLAHTMSKMADALDRLATRQDQQEEKLDAVIRVVNEMITARPGV